MFDMCTALAMMKARLNRLAGDTSLDEYFTARLMAAVNEIEGTGIELSASTEDMMMAVDLAVYEYQNRDKQTGLPDWLRMRIKERWLRQGVAEG